eukprot:gb/GEZJ01003909.1/.p1 GENE.gb/GEZJ01003909.1/~~gb/GEZJ01003909.1/.p1  ORF type:complete len:941 (+),score=160.83 gb/GEZJ01003909.1/:732-3554(+)
MGVRQVEKMMAAASEIDNQAENDAEWSLQEDSSHTNHNTVSGYFSPEVGNVVFASALDGWAFRIIDFAHFFSEREGISRRVLNKTLWGEYYLEPKAKRIVRRKVADVRSKSKPLFVQCIMANIHAVYDTLLKTQHDHDLAVQKRKHFVSKLGIKVNSRDLNHRDASTALKAIMNSWLPASSCLLNTVIEKMPCVAEAQVERNRLQALWGNPDIVYDAKFEDERVKARVIESLERQKKSISQASTNTSDPFIAYVAKMIEKDADSGGGQINIRTPKSLEDGEKAAGRPNPDPEEKGAAARETMVAFARILSGKLSVGDHVFVYSPKFKFMVDGRFDESLVSEATVTGLYLLMGRGMNPIRSASAGCIVGIGGLEDCVLKTATLSSEPPGYCLPVGFNSSAGTFVNQEALVRVAVEPHLHSEAGKLQTGLRKLNQADPAVETLLSAKGEHIIAANGELHLERCLKDLRERFAKGVRIHVSKPIVPFRETVNGGASPHVPLPVEPQSTCTKAATRTETTPTSGIMGRSDIGINQSLQTKSAVGSSSWRINVEKSKEAPSYIEPGFINQGHLVCVTNDSTTFRITATPLPPPLATVLDRAGVFLRSQEQGGNGDAEKTTSLRQELVDAIEEFAQESSTRRTSQSSIVNFWLESVFPRVWSCGPKQFGSNILIGPYSYNGRTATVRAVFGREEETTPCSPGYSLEIEKAIVNGFQLGTRAGPLCEEPMHGVAFLIDLLEAKDIDKDDLKAAIGPEGETNEVNCSDYGDFSRPNGKSSITSGVLLGCVREAVRTALIHGNARLMEGVLHVDISVPGEVLGKTYTVLGQRRGRVLNEEMKEGVNVFGIEAYMPVQDSFGFADVLRKQTSGFAVPQMVFSHWESIELDPFWYPQTEEELEDLGASDTTAENNNIARKLVNGIRRRKGLKVEEKIVVDAEKQRTLSRKK